MHSNGEDNSGNSPRDDDSKEPKEIMSGTIEMSKAESSDRTVWLREIRNNLSGIKEFATVATQTPLTWVTFTLTQPPLDKHIIDPTTLPAHFNPELNHDAKDLVTITECLPTTSQNPLQISASFASNKSGLKSEVLTLTTDYGSPPSDAHGALIDETGIGNSRPPTQNVYSIPENREPVVNESPARRRVHQRWSLYNCLPCVFAVNNEPDTHPRDAPPSYSAIYRSHVPARNRRLFRARNRSSFIAPTPPPSYAQAQEINYAPYPVDRTFSIPPNSSRFWSPRPTTAICPRCTTIVVTTIEVRQSIDTHVTAVALFLCGCWPCCMIPYCMNACKIIDHYCPICHAYLGTYRPW